MAVWMSKVGDERLTTDGSPWGSVLPGEDGVGRAGVVGLADDGHVHDRLSVGWVYLGELVKADGDGVSVWMIRLDRAERDQLVRGERPAIATTQ